MLLNVVCGVDCPANCRNCKWSDTVTATVCDLGKCAARTFQDTSVSNYACMSTSPSDVNTATSPKAKAAVHKAKANECQHMPRPGHGCNSKGQAKAAD